MKKLLLLLLACGTVFAQPVPWNPPAAIRNLFISELSEHFVSEEADSVPVWTRLTSTFSGWSSNIGVRDTFQVVKFYIQPFDVTLIPATVRVRIRANNSAGAILGDAQVSVDPALNTPYMVSVTFSSPITSALPLWFEMFTDGRTGVYEVSSQDFPIGSFPQARYSIDANTATPGTTTAFSGTTQMTQLVRFYTLGLPRTAVLSSSFNKSLATDTLLSKIFNYVYAFTNTATLASSVNAAWENESSTFTGWGALAGPQQNFSAVRFFVRPWSAPITRVRAVVKETDVNGTVLGDQTVNITSTVGVAQRVVISFGTNIANVAATPLYVEYHTDNLTGLYRLPTIPYSGTVNYWTGLDPASPGSPSATTPRNFALDFGDTSGDIQSFTPTTALSQALNLTTPAAVPTVKIELPTILYAVEGVEFNVYFRNVIAAAAPWDQLQYNVVCSVGNANVPKTANQFNRFWRVTPVIGDVGSYTWTLEVYYGGALITSKACTLVVKAKTVGGGATRKFNLIGDSTTIDGRPLAELKRMDTDFDTGLAISLQGTKTGSNGTDSAGGTQTGLLCEAVSGQTFSYFYTNAASAFVTGGVFSYNYYLTNNSLTMASGDWVGFALGINDTFSFTDDVNLQATISTRISQLDAMIASIKAGVSGVRVALFLTIPYTDQNGFAYAYGSGQTSWRAMRNRSLLVQAFLAYYDNRQDENIFVFPYNAILDTDYNTSVSPVQIAQNALQPTLTFDASINGVHPASFGYWQMGQSLWSFLKAQEN